ncbi:MAG: hypothetical protein H5U40_10320, partial [Polyangiaceae bacterium]|nr:hypothetical protein [Polyangiaceae bacterium]
TAHELAHQWFQGLVATNEVRHPMLDEGLTTWAGYDLAGALFGRATSFSKFPALNVFDVLRPFVMVPSDPPAARAVTQFSWDSYGRVIYGRVPLLFETLARTFGRHRVHQALGDYARRHRFAHPVPEDLMAALERAFGPNVVRDIVRPALFHGADASVRLTRENGALVAERTGAIRLPSEVAIRCRDGRSTRIAWPSTESRFVAPTPTDCVPVDARIDPSRSNLLDAHTVDDHIALDGYSGCWFSQALAWAVSWLMTVGP